MVHENYSAIIIGSGLAGLYSAIKLSQVIQNGKILMITKCDLGESNSRYAQGGIVGVLKENEVDSVASHVSDTLNAGAGLSDFNVVKYISEMSNDVIHDLINLGVPFDRDENGNLLDDYKDYDINGRVEYIYKPVLEGWYLGVNCDSKEEEEDLSLYSKRVLKDYLE